MSRDQGKSVGERIVNFCIGALACAICLTIASDLLLSLWPWLVAITLIGSVATFFYWRNRRW